MVLNVCEPEERLASLITNQELMFITDISSRNQRMVKHALSGRFEIYVLFAEEKRGSKLDRSSGHSVCQSKNLR